MAKTLNTFFNSRLYPFSLESSELETSLIPGLSLPLNTEERENRSRLIWERRASNPGSEHALQAFRLLRNNPKVQVINLKAFNLLNNTTALKCIGPI